MACLPREGVTRDRSRPQWGGYRHAGMPPIASGIVMAIGQLPTDSFGARSVNKDRLGFGCPWQGGQGRKSDGLRTPHQGQMPLCTSGVTASKRCLVTQGPSNGSAHTDSQRARCEMHHLHPPRLQGRHRCRHRSNHSPLGTGSRSAVVRPRPTPGATSQSVGRSLVAHPSFGAPELNRAEARDWQS